MGGAAASCVLGLFLAGVEEFWELVVTAFGGKVGGGEFGCYGFCELIPVPGAVWGDKWRRGGELSRRDSCSAVCARCRRGSDWVIGWGLGVLKVKAKARVSANAASFSWAGS